MQSQRMITNDPMGKFENASFIIPTDKDNFVGPDNIRGTSEYVINSEIAFHGVLEVEGIAGNTTVTYFVLTKLADGTYSRIPLMDGAGNQLSTLIEVADGAEQALHIPNNALNGRNIVLQATVAVAVARVQLKT